MIPKILHQTWKSEIIPEKFKQFQAVARQLHPDWEYKLWTDADNVAFIKQNFPKYLQLYEGFPKSIMRADFIRYAIMSKIGGIYLDLDYEMLQPFNLEKANLVLPFNREVKYGDDHDGFGNCIFASAANHPFWEFLMEKLTEIQDYKRFFLEIAKEDFINSRTTLEEAITGPALITRSVRAFNNFHEGDLFPDKIQFHPTVPRNKTQYQEITSNKLVYGIHHCEGTWRQPWLVRKLKKLI